MAEIIESTNIPSNRQGSHYISEFGMLIRSLRPGHALVGMDKTQRDHARWVARKYKWAVVTRRCSDGTFGMWRRA